MSEFFSRNLWHLLLLPNGKECAFFPICLPVMTVFLVFKFCLPDGYKIIFHIYFNLHLSEYHTVLHQKGGYRGISNKEQFSRWWLWGSRQLTSPESKHMDEIISQVFYLFLCWTQLFSSSSLICLPLFLFPPLLLSSLTSLLFVSSRPFFLFSLSHPISSIFLSHYKKFVIQLFPHKDTRYSLWKCMEKWEQLMKKHHYLTNSIKIPTPCSFNWIHYFLCPPPLPPGVAISYLSGNEM